MRVSTRIMGKMTAPNTFRWKQDDPAGAVIKNELGVDGRFNPLIKPPGTRRALEEESGTEETESWLRVATVD